MPNTKNGWPNKKPKESKDLESYFGLAALGVALFFGFGNLLLIGTDYESTMGVGILLSLFFLGIALGYNREHEE